MSKKLSLTNAILLGLEKTIDDYVRLEDFANNPGYYAYGYDRSLKKSSLAKAIARLRSRGFIEKDISATETIFKLTEKGKDKAILMTENKKKWDGKWRLVLFDIPERKRSIRLLLRKKLKEWGFVQWQKSVWASKKNCTNELRRFIKQAGISKWVLVLESDNVGF